MVVSFIDGRNHRTLGKSQTLPQVTDKLYHKKSYLVHFIMAYRHQKKI
jgi:hypothetical protein